MTESTQDRTLAIQRMTALWALAECGLGGVLHALNSPFTGLVVGSVAMLCIALIGSLSDYRWKTVMTSLVVVLVIKGLVSPHSSPTAYIAVAFQGVTGALILRFLPGLPGLVLFFVLGQLESAVQRLLVLTLLYGKPLWEAIDLWGEWVAGKWGMVLSFSSSTLLIGIYLAIHVLVGILVGWWAHRIHRTIRTRWGDPAYTLILSPEDRKAIALDPNRRRDPRRRWMMFIVLVGIITAAYVLAPGESHWGKALWAVVRAGTILALWFLFLAPWLIRLLQRFLHRRHEQLAGTIARTMDLFPALLWILDKAWRETRGRSAIGRSGEFLTRSLLYILQFQYHGGSDPDGAGSQR